MKLKAMYHSLVLDPKYKSNGRVVKIVQGNGGTSTYRLVPQN